MSAIFEAVIKSMPNGKWYIELRDKESDRSVECFSIDEFAKYLNDWGEEYSHDVNVVWSNEENVSQIQINEVRMEMMEYENRLNSGEI